MRAETDDLLQASLASYVAPAAQPWRLESQFWVAFFGGPLAAGAIAHLNAGRLGLSHARRSAVLGIVLAALVLEVVAVYVLAAPDVAAAIGDRSGRALGLAVQGAGVAAYPFLYRVQRRGDRIFRLGHTEMDYSSLRRPGLLAVVAGGLLGIALARVALSLEDP